MKFFIACFVLMVLFWWLSRFGSAKCPICKRRVTLKPVYYLGSSNAEEIHCKCGFNAVRIVHDGTPLDGGPTGPAIAGDWHVIVSTN